MKNELHKKNQIIILLLFLSYIILFAATCKDQHFNYNFYYKLIKYNYLTGAEINLTEEFQIYRIYYFHSSQNKIVFAKGKEVYILNSDGTDLKIISGINGYEDRISPTLSPKGDAIMFLGNDFHLYIINTDGTNSIRLSQNKLNIDYPFGYYFSYYHDYSEVYYLTYSSNRNFATFSFSPDGTKVAYFNNNGLHVVNSDGTNHKTIYSQYYAGTNNYPSWNNLGTKIVFSSFVPGGEYHIFTINVDGTGLTDLTSPHGLKNSRNPKFSPDGSKICFTNFIDIPNYLDDEKTVYSINPDGTNFYRVTSPTDNLEFISWSQDSAKIHLEKTGFKYFVCNIDGTNKIEAKAGIWFDSNHLLTVKVRSEYLGYY